MSFQNRASTDARLAARIVALALLSVAAAAAAAPATLAEAERIALERDAGAAAGTAEAVAFRERAVAARQLPDPEARVGVVNVPVDSFALSRDDMTMLEIGVMQRFEPERRPMSARLERLAEASDARAAARRREVLLAVRSAWLEAAATARERELVREQRGWLERLVAAATSMYAAGEAGRGSQAEVLNARLELAMIEERDLMLAEQGAMRRAALARWLGDIVEARPELTRPGPPAPLATLEARLLAHPVQAATAAEVAAAVAEVDVARAKFRPMWAVDVAYGFRSGHEAMGAEPTMDPMAPPAPAPRRPDMLSGMVTVQLPLFTRDRQERELAAARAEVRASEALRDDQLRMLTMTLREAHARATRAAAALNLLEARVLPAARAAADAALDAYAAGAGDYETVAMAARARLDAEIRRLRTATELATAGAQLDALAGELP